MRERGPTIRRPRPLSRTEAIASGGNNGAWLWWKVASLAADSCMPGRGRKFYCTIITETRGNWIRSSLLARHDERKDLFHPPWPGAKLVNGRKIWETFL